MRKLILALSVPIFLLILASWTIANDRPKSISIKRISLQIDCQIHLNAFAIKNLSTGVVEPFNHGQAFIRAKDIDKLQIVSAPEYDQVSFKGDIFIAPSKTMKVFQSCSEDNNLNEIFNSMNNRFGS